MGCCLLSLSFSAITDEMTSVVFFAVSVFDLEEKGGDCKIFLCRVFAPWHLDCCGSKEKFMVCYCWLIRKHLRLEYLVTELLSSPHVLSSLTSCWRKSSPTGNRPTLAALIFKVIALRFSDL